MCDHGIFVLGIEEKGMILCLAGSYCSTSITKEKWGHLDGTFSLSTIPKRVIFYLEGPSPGIDLLIKSVAITSTGSKGSEVT